jgi:glycine cleavage system H protein
MVPDGLHYTAEHEWVRIEDDGTAVFGITDFAQDALGDIVYVSLPGLGDALAAGAPCGEVESTKSVSDIYAPLAGEVTAVNPDLDGSPEILNSDPYGSGWLVRMAPSDASAVAGLLSAAEYEALISAT